MFRSIFNPDNGLMITMSQITDWIFLSLFWFLGAVPVITIGVSTAALYDAAYHIMRKGDKHPWQRFWRSYRTNLKAGILPGILALAAGLAGGKGLIAVWNRAAVGDISMGVFAGAAFVGMLALGILSVLFPLLSRFENTTLQLLKNTLLLSVAYLPRTLILGFISAATLFLCVWYVFPLFFLPCIAALISTFLLEPMFRPYMPQEAE